MYPMLAGLGPLFCDGAVGGETDVTGDRLVNWAMASGNFFYGDSNYIELPASDSISCPAKTAILISRYTASSGEVVATTFKGRPKTRFFGERSAGYTTVTNWEPISDDLFMSISVSYYVDRTEQVYKTTIPPDTAIDFDPTPELEKDPFVSTALMWLGEAAGN